MGLLHCSIERQEGISLRLSLALWFDKRSEKKKKKRKTGQLVTLSSSASSSRRHLLTRRPRYQGELCFCSPLARELLDLFTLSRD